jgi:ABC-type transport system involved in multi-copper enzyme maturation permease subunit
MTLLPIVERELRVASRQRGTYWLRTGVALAVIMIGMFIYLNGRNDAPAQISLGMFYSLTILAGLFCLFAGARATADCLSEEKRDGTLGLLFLTDLNGFDVVAGKLVAGSLNTFYGLLATLPMLAIPLLMGGVNFGEFWRVAVVLVNTMFFSLAAGMIASALTKSARASAGLCMLIVLGFTVILPMTGGIIASLDHWPNVPELFLIPSPGTAFTYAFASNFAGHGDAFLLSVAFTHGLSWMFLVAACIIVPRSWQDKSATVTQLRWRDRWLRWSLGDSTERARYRARLLDVNAFYWLASRSRIKPALVWGVIGVLTCGWFWGWLRFRSDWTEPMVGVVTALILNTLLKGWFAGEACAQLAEDRRSGALELLLSTPLDVGQVLRGQFLALCRQFLWPAVFAVTVELIFLFAGLSRLTSDRTMWVFVWVSGLVVFIADLATLFHVCLWQSLTARNANRANSAAVVRIMALPWIIYVVIVIVIGTFNLTGGLGTITENLFVFLWLMISLIVDAFFGLRAKLKLDSEFRQVATARYTPPASLWKKLFGAGRDAVPRP